MHVKQEHLQHDTAREGDAIETQQVGAAQPEKLEVAATEYTSGIVGQVRSLLPFCLDVHSVSDTRLILVSNS